MTINKNVEELVKSIWEVDTSHSRVGFAARHMIISEVTGEFKKFDVKAAAGDDFTDSEVEMVIDVSSIDTGNKDRDNHLKSADFFDVENYKEMVFKSDHVEKVNDEKLKIKGNLTIKDITKPVELDVTFGGKIKDPYGKERAGFKIKASLNRFDYDLKWNALMETGGAVVGKTINVICDIELTKSE